MRSFQDQAGNHWQAALLEASYGTILLVFSPLGGAELRQLPSPAQNLADAMDALDGMDTEALLKALDAARPWDPATAGP